MSLMKEAQEAPAPAKKPQGQFHPRAKPRMSAYPDYTKSLVSQRQARPVAAGVARAGQTGLTGAVLGALIARLVSDKPANVAIGAGAGGVLGAIPGFISGKHEAESEYSKLLFLRRRMGINEPGELDALLQHPEISAAMIQKKSGSAKQAAVNPATIKALAGALTGGALGAGWGYKVSPQLSGYADVEPARRLSGVAGTATGALIGALAGGKPGALKAFMSNPRTAMLVPTGLVSGELVPSAIAMMSRQSKATQDLADATNAVSVPAALTRMGRSPITAGAAVGAGAAGLGSLVTGLTRAKTDDEIRKNKSRAGMVGSDFVKYLIPAVLGGGVVGSFGKS